MKADVPICVSKEFVCSLEKENWIQRMRNENKKLSTTKEWVQRSPTPRDPLWGLILGCVAGSRLPVTAPGVLQDIHKSHGMRIVLLQLDP